MTIPDYSAMKSSRSSAKVSGDTHYFTGEPCKHGHISPRRTANGNCVECIKDMKKKYYNSSPYVKERSNKRSRECRRNASGRAFTCYETWTPEEQQKAEKYNEVNRSRSRSWQNNNPAKAKIRKSRVQRATPEWVDFSEMDEIYFQAHLLAQSTGIPHVVDHIEPLYGKTCCGLNVPWNLQALPAHLNREKSNSRTWTHPDYEVPNTIKMKMPGTSPGTFTEILLQGSQSPE